MNKQALKVNGHARSADVAVDTPIWVQVVNFRGAENQVQGSVINGPSTLMYQELGAGQCRIVQSNLHEYPLGAMCRAMSWP